MERPAIADYPPGARLPERVIDDHEFVWMLRGQARVTSADGEMPLSPGQLLLVPPGIRHGFAWDQTHASRHGYVHFQPRDEEAGDGGALRVRPMTADDPLAALCAYVLWLGLAEGHEWREPAQDALDFMVRLFRQGPLPHPQPPTVLAPALAAGLHHLQRTWAHMPLRRVGVAELASVAHVSPGYLHRLFRAAFGMSTAAALEQVRCSRAEALLLRTDLTIEVIARQCGFADASHFSHRFSAIHGVSPRAYRVAGGAAPSVLEQPGVRRLPRLLWEQPGPD